MKKIMLGALLIGTGLLGGQAFASDMQCYVDTDRFDYFTTGGCSNSGTNRTTVAVFSVRESKDISTILWSGDAAGECSSTASYCTLDIRQFETKSVGATVLYTDGTWETLPEIDAFYEGLF